MDKSRVNDMEYMRKEMLVNHKAVQLLGEDLRKNVIEIRNPLSEDYKLMRPTTIPSIMQILSINNNKKNQEVGLYDISRSYRNTNGQVEKGEIPVEEKILTIGMYGEKVDFYSLKGIIENILEAIGVNKYDIEKETKNTSYHPGRCANLKIGIDNICVFGEVHPEVLENYGITKRAYIAEINVTKLVKYSRSNKKYVEVPKFPAVERDISVTVNEEIEVLQIEKLIRKISKKFLHAPTIIDQAIDMTKESVKKKVKG